MVSLVLDGMDIEIVQPKLDEERALARLRRWQFRSSHGRSEPSDDTIPDQGHLSVFFLFSRKAEAVMAQPLEMKQISNRCPVQHQDQNDEHNHERPEKEINRIVQGVQVSSLPECKVMTAEIGDTDGFFIEEDIRPILRVER